MADQPIFQRQSFRIRFSDEDMDFMLNWILGISLLIGMSPSQVFYAVHKVQRNNPEAWRRGFIEQANFLLEQSGRQTELGQPLQAAQSAIGASCAYRAALQYIFPNSLDFSQATAQMEASFQQGTGLMGIPIRPIDIPFEGSTLPGYLLQHDDRPRPAVVMVGGSDTFREDLFYFAGYPGWKRGYNVIMVDLPGQGATPEHGLYFRADMDQSIRAVIDWLQAHVPVHQGQIAMYGVSGGGYFSAQAAADPRIQAWVAATPIFDIAEFYRKEMGPIAKQPGWLVNMLARWVGAVNQGAAINFAKYAWQFGTDDMKLAIDGVFEQARTVDYTAITCPSLFLVSEGEGAEFKRQANQVYLDFQQRGVDVTMHTFQAAQGADAHGQVNNFRLLHLVIFDWLDALFNHDSGDIRLRC